MEPEVTEAAIQIMKSLGVPGVWLVVLTYTARKIFIWVTELFQSWVVPHVEKSLEAYQKRQETMAECQKKLTESTILIQQENRDKLQAIEDLLPTLCSAKCPIQSGRKG